MCYAIYYVYAECGHDKKLEIVEFCEDFGARTCMLIPVCFKQVDAPSLCVSCFREEEAMIDAKYDAMVELIRGKMTDYEAAQANRQIQGRAQGTVDSYLAQLERDLADAKKLRDLEIRSFRTEQDVWADG